MVNKQRARRGRAYRTVLLTLALVLPLSLMGAVCLGTVKLPISSVYTVIRYELAHLLLGAPFPAEWAPGTAVHDVVWLIRLPRLVLAAAVGGGLSLCGVVMQAVEKNPLADPYVLGVSSGASLGATLAILLGTGATLGGNFVGLMAFLGAFGASLAVVVLAGVGGRASSVRLLLSCPIFLFTWLTPTTPPPRCSAGPWAVLALPAGRVTASCALFGGSLPCFSGARAGI